MLSTLEWMREMESVRRNFDRIFRDAGLDRGLGGWSRSEFLPAHGARTYPLLNVSEDEKCVYVDALAPGMDPGSLNLHIVRDQLHISGNKPGPETDVEASAYHRNERAAARFVRTLTLPAPVDGGKAKARYRNGILRITIPKAESARPRQIPVSVS